MSPEHLQNRLRELARLPPSEERLQEAAAALQSKYEGVQVVAAYLLGHWGDSASREVLRSWLTAMCHSAARTAIVPIRAAATALSQCVRDEDAPWIMDLIFESHCRCERCLFAMMRPLSPRAVAARLTQESTGNPAPACRHTALVLAYEMQVPGWPGLVKGALRDRDKEIRAVARVFSPNIDDSAKLRSIREIGSELRRLNREKVLRTLHLPGGEALARKTQDKRP